MAENDTIPKMMLEIADYYKQATEAYYRALQAHSKAKREVERAFAIGIARGIYAGKNEDARFGEFIQDQPDLVLVMDRCEEELTLAKMNLELARIEDTYVERSMALVNHVSAN